MSGIDREKAAWMDDARCVGGDPDVFFPPPGNSEQAQEARVICRRCPVRGDCLEYALEHRIGQGIWGGKTARERRRILKARATGGETGEDRG